MSADERLDAVWSALDCAPNPDDFKTSVQEAMWTQALEMIRASTRQDHRIYRESAALLAENADLRRKLAEAEAALGRNSAHEQRERDVDELMRAEGWNGHHRHTLPKSLVDQFRTRVDDAAVRSQEPPTEPELRDDGTLALPCGSLWSGADREAWRADHLPACAICLGNFGPPEPKEGDRGCPGCGMSHDVEKCRAEGGTCDCCRSIIGPVLP